MIIQELVPPYRQARVAILLHALGIPWLKDRCPLTIREDLVYAGNNVVAKIIFDRPRMPQVQWPEAKRR